MWHVAPYPCAHNPHIDDHVILGSVAKRGRVCATLLFGNSRGAVTSRVSLSWQLSTLAKAFTQSPLVHPKPGTMCCDKQLVRRSNFFVRDWWHWSGSGMTHCGQRWVSQGACTVQYFSLLTHVSVAHPTIAYVSVTPTDTCTRLCHSSRHVLSRPPHLHTSQ